MLARREHSRAELAKRLGRGDADPAEVASVLDALERDGYLSDARYAQAVVARKAGRYGKRAIAHALREHGVHGETARDALQTLGDVDEVAHAAALLARRFPGAIADERDRARRIRFLTSRGFGLSTAHAALDRARREATDRD